MAGALAPYVVLDLTVERGWLCGRMLADLGAEVIKVEPPEGDPGRRSGLFVDQSKPDPEENLNWWIHNRGKSSVVLDLATAADRERLLQLVESADALIESYDPGWLEAHDLGPEVLLARNPRLVVTSITPFGRTGPYINWSASDLIVAAMTGEMWLTGDPDRAPVRISSPQLFLHAAAEAASNTLIALWHAQETGQGQHVDVSAQLAGMKTLMNAPSFHLLEGRELTRMGSCTAYSSARFKMILDCVDGYTVLLPLGGPLGGPVMRFLMDWADRYGVADPTVRDCDFSTINFATADRDFFDGVTKSMEGLFARHTKAELYKAALEHLLLLAPVNTVADLRVDEQLAAREYFVTFDDAPVTAGDGTALQWPGAWAKFSETPLSTQRRAPRIGEHTDAVLARPARSVSSGAGIGGLSSRSTGSAIVGAPSPAMARKGPFDGLKVFDMSWVGVGPMTAGYLANYGATVIHVESSKRPDVLRVTPPFLNGQPGLNNSHFFGDFNPNKLGLGLDVNDPRGREIAWKGVEWADIVLESFTPKALEKWGMGYDQMRERNPSVVLLSTCMQGQTGPRRLYRGFGNLMAGLCGFYQLTGWPDRGPTMIYGAYTDFVAQRFATTAMFAALDHRRRTGEGQHVDVSQFEAALQFQGAELLAYEIDGRVAERCGNRDIDRAPHGVFACRPEAEREAQFAPGSPESEGWVAIACEDDAQWQVLRDVIGLADEPGWRTVAGRKNDEDRIERLLSAWTDSRRASEIVARLQPRVSAAPVLHVPELHSDPQINHREFWHPLEHPVYGTVPYCGLQASFSVTPGDIHTPAPCLGQHSWEVLEDLLGVDLETIGELLADGVVEITG